jgi:8-oxo-dGTP pyrophosphatase MutT (NUDIX family)
VASEEISRLEFFAPGRLPRLPLWYADMLRDCLAGREAAHFDPPEHRHGRFNEGLRPSSGHGEPESEFWALRAAFGQEPFIAAGAAVFARDERGRVLLHRRSDTGRWGLPAGSLHLGESLAATAVRETREETGLIVEPFRLVGIYSGYGITYPNGDQLHIFNNLFECRITGGELRADGIESLDARLFSPEELPPTLDRRFDQRIADALSGQAAAFVR